MSDAMSTTDALLNLDSLVLIDVHFVNIAKESKFTVNWIPVIWSEDGTGYVVTRADNPVRKTRNSAKAVEEVKSNVANGKSKASAWTATADDDGNVTLDEDCLTWLAMENEEHTNAAGEVVSRWRPATAEETQNRRRADAVRRRFAASIARDGVQVQSPQAAVPTAAPIDAEAVRADERRRIEEEAREAKAQRKAAKAARKAAKAARKTERQLKAKLAEREALILNLAARVEALEADSAAG